MFYICSGVTIGDVQKNIINIHYDKSLKTFTFERKIKTEDTNYDFDFSQTNYFMFIHINNEKVWHITKKVTMKWSNISKSKKRQQYSSVPN